MKYHLILISQLILHLGICFAQKDLVLNSDEYEINYRYTYQIDSNVSDSKKEIIMQLHYNKGKSQYQSVEKRKSDSVVNATQSTMIFYSYGTINPNNYLIEKNSEYITTYESINGIGLNGNNELFAYVQPRTIFDWNLHGDTATISGYLCQKATVTFGNRSWVAWFTQDIPVSDGPYKFYGLPGLIVSVYDEDDFFKFEMLSIQKTKNAWSDLRKIRNDMNLTEVDQQRFFEERKKFRANMIEFAILQGNNLTEKQKENIREQVRIDNNHIEKY